MEPSIGKEQGTIRLLSQSKILVYMRGKFHGCFPNPEVRDEQFHCDSLQDDASSCHGQYRALTMTVHTTQYALLQSTKRQYALRQTSWLFLLKRQTSHPISQDLQRSFIKKKIMCSFPEQLMVMLQCKHDFHARIPAGPQEIVWMHGIVIYVVPVNDSTQYLCHIYTCKIHPFHTVLRRGFGYHDWEAANKLYYNIRNY